MTCEHKTWAVDQDGNAVCKDCGATRTYPTSTYDALRAQAKDDGEFWALHMKLTAADNPHWSMSDSVIEAGA